MRLMFGIGTRVFHAEFSTGRWTTGDDEPDGEPMRDTALDSLVERADPHPEPDRPIGFRRNGDDW